ncbi:MAG: hypothetical protein ACREDK_09195 [Thermoplasmata archaeon]
MAVRRSAPLAERELFGAYPFLPGAESLVAEFSPSLRDLFTDPAFERAREIGRARIRTAADDPTGATGIAELAHASAEESFLSFLYARLLLSSAPTLAPLRRWAVAEAKLGWSRLRASPVDEMVDVARRLDFEMTSVGADVKMPVTDYLELAAPIREGDYRLVRQALKGGEVALARERGARLLQEGVRVRLSIPILIDASARDLLLHDQSDFLADLARRLPTPVPRVGGPAGPLRPERFPPCIRKMRRMLEAGENLSHAGRFALAAFLYKAGAHVETIVDAFRGAPDFDEGITRYQVEHITQHDQGRGYEPPECATVRSHGLCFRDGDPTATEGTDRARDPLCFEPFLKHPLQYYRIRGGSVAERGDASFPVEGATRPSSA